MHRPTLNTAIKQNVSQQHEETPETLLFRGFFEEFSYENGIEENRLKHSFTGVFVHYLYITKLCITPYNLLSMLQ